MTRNIYLIVVSVLVLGSCTKDFEKININPNAPASVPLSYLLGQSQLYIAGSAGDPGYATWRANLIYALPAVQQFASLSTFYAGDKYLYQADLSEAYFNTQYPSAIKNLVNLIDLASVDPNDINILSMARILKAFQMQMITDLYGDVPYSEAGKGFSEVNFTPAYDEQSAIYMDILKELDEAGDALNASAPIPSTADFVYRGDIAKWKKFANSLMLRMAMRMQKADAAAAETWAGKALTKGVMSDNSETFAFIHAEGASSGENSNSYNLGGSSRQEVNNGSIQWSKTLIDIMKDRVDPRLSVISILKNGDMAAADQKGLPNGYDANTFEALTGEVGADAYSRPSAQIYDVQDPNMYMTHAEVRFLTAEAIERGWFDGDAMAEYVAGQAAAVTQVNAYNPVNPVSNLDVTAYQAANLYPAAGSLDAKMTEIHTEMFILTAATLNGFEGWANWRRTNIPALTPTNFAGNPTGGTVMRRLRYPGGEAGVNPNYQVAVARQGPDDFKTRVWWDKP